MSTGGIRATQLYPALIKASSLAKAKNRTDAYRRKLFRKSEGKRRIYKSIAYDTNLPHKERVAAESRLKRLPRNASPSRQKKRCVLTGRPKGVLSDFRISRLCFRELMAEGLLPGVTKASW